MTGKPVLAASASDNVLFPDPASPVTTTRRPSAKAASLIAVSVPHVPSGDARHICWRVTLRATPRKDGRIGHTPGTWAMISAFVSLEAGDA